MLVHVPEGLRALARADFPIGEMQRALRRIEQLRAVTVNDPTQLFELGGSLIAIVDALDGSTLEAPPGSVIYVGGEQRLRLSGPATIIAADQASVETSGAACVIAIGQANAEVSDCPYVRATDQAVVSVAGEPQAAEPQTELWADGGATIARASHCSVYLDGRAFARAVHASEVYACGASTIERATGSCCVELDEQGWLREAIGMLLLTIRSPETSVDSCDPRSTFVKHMYGVTEIQTLASICLSLRDEYLDQRRFADGHWKMMITRLPFHCCHCLRVIRRGEALAVRADDRSTVVLCRFCRIISRIHLTRGRSRSPLVADLRALASVGLSYSQLRSDAFRRTVNQLAFERRRK